jgi:hypothetical protein
MAAPWWWRIVRAAAAAVAVGFVVLSLVAIAESLSQADPEGEGWSLGKAEELGWAYALLVLPVLLLTPLPRAWGWGFVWAVTPVGVLWFTFDLATGVSATLHYADPFWIDAVALAFVYFALVPWVSWVGLATAVRSQRAMPVTGS